MRARAAYRLPVAALQADELGLVSGLFKQDIASAAAASSYHRAVELIGRRWTGAILRAMLTGVSRLAGSLKWCRD